MESKGDRTRQRILEATIKSVAKNGFEFSTATTISKEAGVNRGLIVHYFSTIEKLIKEATRSVGEFIIHRTNEILAGNMDKADPIQRYFAVTFGLIKERPHYALFLLSLVSRASYDKKSNAAVLVVFSSGRERIQRILTEGNKSGVYQCKDVSGTALQLHAVLIGNLMSFLINPEEVDLAYENAIRTAEAILR